MKDILVILILLGSSLELWAQSESREGKQQKEKLFVDTSTLVINYDFQKGEYVTPLKRIKVHTPVVFKITNINPFAYKVKITPKDSIQESAMTERDIAKLFTEVRAQEMNDKITEASNNKTGITQGVNDSDIKENKNIKEPIRTTKDGLVAIGKIEELQKRNSDVLVQLDTIKQHILSSVKDSVDSTFNSLKTEMNNIRLKDSVSIKAFADIAKRLVTNNNERAKAHKDVQDLQQQYNDNIQLIKSDYKKIDESLRAFQSLYYDFIDKYESFKGSIRAGFYLLRSAKELDNIANIPTLTYTSYSKSYGDVVKAILASIQDNQEKAQDYKANYAEMVEVYYKLIYTNTLDDVLEASGVAKMKAYPEYLWKKAESLNKILDTYPIQKIVGEAVAIAERLTDSNGYEIASDPIQPEGDILQFKVEVKKNDNIKREGMYIEREFFYKQPLYGGFRMDWSIGLAGSMYPNTATYTLDADSKIQKTDDKHLFSPAFVGLATMSKRKTGYLAWGASGGMGLDINSGKVQISNFYAGATLLLGRKERLFITAGLSVKNVRKIRNGLVGQKVTPSSDLSSFMLDKYKLGPFLSLSYSLTKESVNLIKTLK